MKEDWTEQLRRKLENYEVEPPPGLWEDICKQMGLEPEPASKKPAISRWWWAVAAVVLVLVGFFLIYNSSDGEQPLQANAVSQEQVPEKPSSEQQSSEQLSSEQPSSEQPSPELLSLERSSSKQPLAQLSSSQQPSNAIVLDEYTDTLVISEPAEEQEPASNTEAPSYTESGKKEMYEEPAMPQPKTSVSPNKWSVGLMASGGLLAANNSQRTERVYYGPSYFGDAYSLSGTYENNPAKADYPYTLTEYVSKHHLPLRLGLSLQYQLNPRLALLSGISYTRLSSEFSLPLYQNMGYSQRLHYVGIPLGVTWQLWKASHFCFYLSGGTMVEKCVSVDVDGGYTGKKPWQWSVNAAAGAEYAFTSLLGAYLEPSLGYYFSDGTQLEHYYKEHPLAPSIEFGLRMHLGR